MQKRIRSVVWAVILAMALLLGLTACAGKTEKPVQTEAQQTTTAAEVQTTSEPETEAPPETTEPETTEEETTEPESERSGFVEEDGWYYDKDHVAAYIHEFGTLPGNYITKKEARKLGWSGGSVERYEEGRAIGGDTFGNREGLLPKKSGRKYYECDIDTNGKSERGKKRIIYSNDGLIYYTDDHYSSFSLLYGEE